jgi:hypothetical protein
VLHQIGGVIVRLEVKSVLIVDNSSDCVAGDRHSTGNSIHHSQSQQRPKPSIGARKQSLLLAARREPLNLLLFFLLL